MARDDCRCRESSEMIFMIMFSYMKRKKSVMKFYDDHIIFVFKKKLVMKCVVIIATAILTVYRIFIFGSLLDVNDYEKLGQSIVDLQKLEKLFNEVPSLSSQRTFLQYCD